VPAPLALATVEEVDREDDAENEDNEDAAEHDTVENPEAADESDNEPNEAKEPQLARFLPDRAPVVPAHILADKLEWLAAVQNAAPEVKDLRSRIRPLGRALDLTRNYAVRGTYPETFVASVKNQYRQQSSLRAESLRRMLGLDLDEENDEAELAKIASNPKKKRDNLDETAIFMTLILQHLNAVNLRGTYAVLRQELAERGVLFEPDLTDAYEATRRESRLLTVLRNSVRRSDRLWTLSTGGRFESQRATAERLEELLVSMGLLNQDLEEEEDVNIWLEPDQGTLVLDTTVAISAGEQPPIRAASLNKLIEKLTDERGVDLSFIPTFLLTYRSFTTPDKLLGKLKERFDVPTAIAAHRGMDEETFRAQVTRPVQLRVISFIKKWIEDYFYDVDDRLAFEIKEFLKFAAKTSSALQRLCAGVIQNLEKRRQRAMTGSTGLPPPAKVPRNIFAPNLSLYQIDPEEVARQLTLITWEVFAAILPSELLNQSWNKPTLRYRAPNVLKMVASFNHLSQSVATLIVTPKRVKLRAKALDWWIKVADHCRQLNNFHSMTSTVAGINSGPCFRLRHTKHEASKGTLEMLEGCSSILDTDGSWAGYRKRLALATPPLIPHLGIHLTDLVFIEEGNKDVDGGLINFAKRRLLHQTISQIQQFQQTSYSLQPVHQIQDLLLKIRPEDSRALMKLSLEREPREAVRASIA
jgi:hypothetical protein